MKKKAILSVFCVCGVVAMAGTYTFMGGEGDWSVGGSWGGVVPGALDVVQIGMATDSSDAVVRIWAGEEFAVNSIRCGSGCRITDGVVQLMGGRLTSSGESYIGHNGRGRLEQVGGEFTNTKKLFLAFGNYPGVWSISNGVASCAELYIGWSGDAELAATNSVLSCTKLQFGQNALATNSVLEVTQGSVMSNSGNTVFAKGFNRMYVTSGSTFTNKGTFQLNGGTNRLVVADAGTSVEVLGELSTMLGSGVVVSNGASVVANVTRLVSAVNSRDDWMMVSGEGTEVTSRGDFYVGYRGPGARLDVTDGAKVSAKTLFNGYLNVSSNAQIRVSGRGSEISATAVHAGWNNQSKGNRILVENEGVLDAGPRLNVYTDNTVRCEGGVLQFSATNPNLSFADPANVVMSGGSLSFRGVTDATVHCSEAGKKFADGTVMTWDGENGFRLNNATNTASVSQGYVFDPTLGATHFARLEMVGGATLYRGRAGDTLTIGLELGAGLMLCRDTAAEVSIPFVNNGTLTLENSMLTLPGGAALQGVLEMDCRKLSEEGVEALITVAGDVTLAGRLCLTGAESEGVLMRFSGTRTGQFDEVEGVSSKYALLYRGTTDGTIELRSTYEHTMILLR